MAHITRFSVSGLAGRKDTYDRVLDRHVNVFFGVNGSGKTSLLRLLDSAMTNDASTLYSVPFISATVHIYSEEYKREVVRTFEHRTLLAENKKDSSSEYMYTVEGKRVRYRSALQWTTEPADKTFEVHWSHIFLPISRMYSPTERMITNHFSSGYSTDLEGTNK